MTAFIYKLFMMERINLFRILCSSGFQTSLQQGISSLSIAQFPCTGGSVIPHSWPLAILPLAFGSSAQYCCPVLYPLFYR